MKNRTPLEWQVSRKEAGIRLIAFLQKHLQTDRSVRYIKRCIEGNLCKVNGSVERFASKVLKEKDRIELNPKWEQQQAKEKISPPQVIYEDDYYRIVDKPPKLSCEEKNFRPFLLTHRLDKDTSGLLILAKSKDAEEQMMQLFEKRQVGKSYLAIVDREVEKESGIIESRLVKKISYQGGAIWSSGGGKDSKEAITHWKRLGKGNKATLLHCEPKTGRTHQIRVHLSEMGYPILGDFQYCRKFSCPVAAERQMLHAYEVIFPHPFFKQVISLQAPLPQDFIAVLKKCRIA